MKKDKTKVNKRGNIKHKTSEDGMKMVYKSKGAMTSVKIKTPDIKTKYKTSKDGIVRLKKKSNNDKSKGSRFYDKGTHLGFAAEPEKNKPVREKHEDNNLRIKTVRKSEKDKVKVKEMSEFRSPNKKPKTRRSTTALTMKMYKKGKYDPKSKGKNKYKRDY